MFVKPRVHLALIAILMVVGLYFLQNHPQAPSVEASQGDLAIIPEVETNEQVALRETSSEPAAQTEKIQPVIWSPEVELVDEILNSKNDNDPRLDTELRYLSEEAKTSLRSYYLSRPEEDRNGKGTVLFLLGRNLKTSEDVEFIAETLKEAPCRSLANCSTEPQVIDHHESHHDTAPEVTLAYPKIVALTMLEKQLMNPSVTPDMRKTILASVRDSLSAEEPIVKKRAAAIIDRLDRQKN